MKGRNCQYELYVCSYNVRKLEKHIRGLLPAYKSTLGLLSTKATGRA